MSGTRSPSRKAPATERPLLLIAAHGERGGDMENRRLRELAKAVGSRLPACEVTCGTLAGTPSIEDAAATADGRPVVVYPFFMANGYFVDEALTKRLRDCGAVFTMLDPLGTDPALVAITARQIEASSALIPSQVLVAAHGSTKDPRSRQATEDFAGLLAKALDHAGIRRCYLEEEPFAEPAIAGLSHDALIVSLFAGDGLHAAGDLPEIMERHGKSGMTVVTPASAVNEIADMIAAATQGYLASNQAA